MQGTGRRHLLARGEWVKVREREATHARTIVVSCGCERWICDAVLLTASAAVRAKEELSRTDPGKHWGNIIINRIIRGVLWTIRNGNAPGWDPLAKDEDKGADRSLECSLSSTWLEQRDTVYIA